MIKLIRDRLSVDDLPIKKRIQRVIDISKDFGEDISWRQAKEFVNNQMKEEIWVNDIYQVNVLTDWVF